MSANPYFPVTTDQTNLTDEDWGLPIRTERKFSRTSRLKNLCSTLHRHRKAVVITSIVMSLSILIIVIIAVSSRGHTQRQPTGGEGKWENTAQGLVFYPVPEDKSVVISFTPEDFQKTARHPLVKSLDTVTKGYNSTSQLNELHFTTCNNSYADYNKTCRVPRVIFGDECTSHRNYGYGGAQPCVFLQLNLPDHVTIKPIKQGSALWNQIDPVLKSSPPDPTHIPVTCRGTTDVDNMIIESAEGYGPGKERIMYYPREGLLSYLYRERNTSLEFLKPAVMVQFTSLMSRHMVHITCVAWGQLYTSNGTMIDHKLLTTQFALYADHS
ncbi:unnamed protein product [Candidula unifasciata]|uniref:Sodium/potassium-transporting ATPase subunit beta n=1 Tax=Candidula unifasciata TaxID=100452 RepID=A0A8S3ZTN7_9EUPU|nr:unnamed protein product [Candidula unifasciata]